ncbi:MAG TPA: glycoside hydrolase family 5 protein [Rhizobacter sp.]|jgi:endoglucanase|nr:glycoside hydrolase family 5 protein [Rhizobacter sp.]
MKLMKWVTPLGGACLLLLCLGLAPARAATSRSASPCLGDKPLRGVNMAGAEFNSTRLPGTLFKDYTYPSVADLRYFAELGANVIRLPFRWERLQRTPGASLDAGELENLRKVVATGRELGLCVILDAHNYGVYAKQPIGSADMPLSAFQDFWLRMREAFPDPEYVAFGLMNEPAKAASRADWVRAGQEVLTALREAGSKHLVLVSGAGWSGAHDWATPHGGISNADAFAGLKDPLRRSAIEVHQYADRNASGMGKECIAPERMSAIMKRVTDWALANQQRLFLGEFGVAPSPECLDTLKAQLEAMRGPAWVGWSYWAAGAWWGPTYTFSVHPLPGVERAQLALLREEW